MLLQTRLNASLCGGSRLGKVRNYCLWSTHTFYEQVYELYRNIWHIEMLKLCYEIFFINFFPFFRLWTVNIQNELHILLIICHWIPLQFTTMILEISLTNCTHIEVVHLLVHNCLWFFFRFLFQNCHIFINCFKDKCDVIIPSRLFVTYWFCAI